MLVNSDDALARLLRLIRSDTRRVPVIVVSKKMDKSGPVIPSIRLQEMLGHRGHVRTLSGVMFGPFNRLMQKFPLNMRGVRLYEPGLNVRDYHTRHPFWNEQVIEEIGADRFLQSLVAHCAREARYRQNGMPPVDSVSEMVVTTIKRSERPVLTLKRRSENPETPQGIKTFTE